MRHQQVPAGSAPYRDPGHIFSSTASYYARIRPGYPNALIDHCARFASGFPGSRVLDLATGTGAVAVALAQYGMDVVGVDPCEEMLDHARRRAAAHGVTGIEWVQGSAHALPDIGRVCLVTIGDAFHWLIPRLEALHALDGLVVPGGAVALLSHRWPGYPKPSWDVLVNRVRDRHLDSPTAGPTGQPSRVEAGTQAEVFRQSPFRDLTKTTVDYELDVALDELVEWQFSQAQTSPHVLGARKDAFEADLRAALAAWEPAGRFAETSQAHLLVGRRPGDPTGGRP